MHLSKHSEYFVTLVLFHNSGALSVNPLQSEKVLSKLVTFGQFENNPSGILPVNPLQHKKVYSKLVTFGQFANNASGIFPVVQCNLEKFH